MKKKETNKNNIFYVYVHITSEENKTLLFVDLINNEKIALMKSIGGDNI
jgi:hypothetical protein